MKRRPPPKTSSKADQPGERLQKVLALAGLGSRRQCEEYIVTGRVEVDGKTVTELGVRVDPEKARIRVDGVSLRRARLVYYVVNKPVGVVSTNSDPAGRTRVIDLVPETRERLFTVGRLDRSSEGLMLVTNDGELANRLAHPRYGVHKTYLAVVAGEPSNEVLEELRRGVRLAEGVARVVSVSVRTRHKNSTLLEIVLAEGKNREIRRMLAKVGHKVMQLKRVALGPLKLGMMQPGEWRRLEPAELEKLQAVAHGRPPKARKGRPTKKAGAKPTGRRQGGAAGSKSAAPERPTRKRRSEIPGQLPPPQPKRTIIGDVEPVEPSRPVPAGSRSGAGRPARNQRRPQGRPVRRKPRQK